jgi:hypothetical protein
MPVRAMPTEAITGASSSTRLAEAEATAAKLAAANKNPKVSFTVTEFEPTD